MDNAEKTNRGKVPLILKFSLVTGICLAFTALFLAGSESVNLQYSVDPKLYLPVALHCALNAFLLLTALQIRQYANPIFGIFTSLNQMAFVWFPLIGIGFANLVVAGKAILTPDTNTLWIAVFFVPALASLWIGFAGLEDDDEEPEESEYEETVSTELPLEESTEQNSFEFVEVGENYGQTELLSTLLSHTFGGLVAAAYIAELIFLFGIAPLYLSVLELVLFDQKSIDLSKLINQLPDLVINMLPYLIAVPTVIFLLILLLGLGSATSQIFSIFQNRDFNSPLTPKEIVFIDKSMAALTDYIEQATYPKWYDRIFLIHIFLFIASIAVWGGGLIALSTISPAILESQRTSGLSWHFYQCDLVVSTILAIFTWIFLFWSASQILALFFPRVGEYLYVKHSWNTMNQEERSFDQFLDTLTKFVRTGAVKENEPFSPRDFIQLGLREFGWAVHSATSFFVILTLIFSFLDLNYYAVFSNKGVAYSNYFSIRVQEISYEKIDRVELGCWLDNDGDPAIEYRVFFDEHSSRDLIKGVSQFTRDLDMIEKIDAEIRLVGVEFRSSQRRGWFNSNKPAHESKCEQVLSEEVDSNTFSRMMKIIQTPIQTDRQG